MQTNRPQGLTQREVEERIQKGLTNKVTVSTEKTTWQIVSGNLFTYFNFIFLVLALLLVLVQSWNNLLFVPIVITNALIGIVQELRARKVLNQMHLLHTLSAKVLRDGREQVLPVEELVQDDVVVFAAGDQIYADGFLLSGSIRVNEAQLTGEADEIEKNRGDAVLSGSFVAAGQGYARLDKVGDHSYINQLAKKAKEVSGMEESKMVHAVNRLVQAIGIVIIPMGLLLFFRSYISNQETLQLSVTSTVGAIVGMIPEGLYLLMTLALVLGAVRLAKQQVLLNSMKGIETLSRVDVLCVDKTGTITENDMAVSRLVFVDGQELEAKSALSQYLAASQDKNDTIETIRAYPDLEQIAAPWTVIQQHPFSSQKKYGAVAFENGVFVLGAPEYVLREDLAKYQHSFKEEAEQGARVLVFGRYQAASLGEELSAAVSPLVFLLLENPVRANAAETFAYFQKQGVAVKVISGDNPVTVSAVARKAAIPHAASYIDARELDTEKKIAQAAGSYTVFGRVSPEQKQQLVQALQAEGHNVAMTGDGVNDILAMKKADCSIAMESGNDATKQIAQVVLLDSDFSHMPHIVAEGRRVVNNIQRSASLFLVKNLFSMLLALASTLFAFTYPLQASQMSLISAFTIGIPGFLLALEPNNTRIRGRFLETVLKNALPAALVDFIAVLLAVFSGYGLGLSSREISTSAIILLAVVGFTLIYKLVQPLNKVKWGILLVNILGMTGAALLLSGVFGVTALSLKALTMTLLLSLTLEILLRFFQWLTDFLILKIQKRAL
ncbi:HAD-IC family P-type ATPase [Streptococcus panodentis]|uniref:ATPase P n=1 Tax=Streptococcus panodentis TaxID=1581472 RepID=A0ABS5AYR3_9STRE|nr:HAD-IC family P-type ATPase [Streptococcus panodentis]MBP2621665.1 ATPase P [Streptococcus panodentis]